MRLPDLTVLAKRFSETPLGERFPNGYALARRLSESPLGERLRARGARALEAGGDRLRRFLSQRPWLVLEAPANRGLDLRRTAPAVSAERSLAEHLAGTVDRRLTRLDECRRFVSAKDPVEALHDLRVASRRLRAFTDVFAPLLDRNVRIAAKTPLRRVTRAVRELRDWDVQIALLEERLDRAVTEAERAALEYLLVSATSQRRHAARSAEKRLRKLDFEVLRVAVVAALGETVAHLPPERHEAARLARDLLDPFVDAAERDLPPDDGLEHAERMHELRIDLKKLRYALELFQPVFGAGYDELYTRVERLQELLGKHHDLVVAERFAERHREELSNGHGETLVQGLSKLTADIARERRDLVAEFRLFGFDPEGFRRSARAALGSA
jgi:CHAD domain-containing protein